MLCKKCNKDMGESIDMLYSNIYNSKVYKGQHVADVYHCSYCNIHYIFDFFEEVLIKYNYN